MEGLNISPSLLRVKKSSEAQPKMTFTNLIRFEDQNGKIRYGDVDQPQNELIGSTAAILTGSPFNGQLQPTGEVAIIHKVRSTYLRPIDASPDCLP